MFGFSSAMTSHNSMAMEHLSLLNKYRAQNGKSELIYDANLSKCIDDYLRHQSTHNYYGHYWPDGSTPTDRCGHLSVKGIGENLISAWYLPNAQKALELWISSVAHKNNMLYTKYKYVGIAAVRDPVTKVWRWGQVFTEWPMKNTTTTNTNTNTLPSNPTPQPWNVNQNTTLPKLINRNIWESSVVKNKGERLRRLQLNLDRRIDWQKTSESAERIARILRNIFDPM